MFGCLCLAVRSSALCQLWLYRSQEHVPSLWQCANMTKFACTMYQRISLLCAAGIRAGDRRRCRSVRIRPQNQHKSYRCMRPYIIVTPHENDDRHSKSQIQKTHRAHTRTENTTTVGSEVLRFGPQKWRGVATRHVASRAPLRTAPHRSAPK